MDSRARSSRSSQFLTRSRLFVRKSCAFVWQTKAKTMQSIPLTGVKSDSSSNQWNAKSTLTNPPRDLDNEYFTAVLGRVLLGLFRNNRNTRNRLYLCSFGSYSVFRMNGISFCSYGFLGKDRMRVLLGNFWREILLGRSRADIVVLRSPPPWVFRFQILGASFSKLKFRVFCFS